MHGETQMDNSRLNKPRQRFYTIAGWCAYSQMSRTATYNAIGRGDLKAVKRGNRTLVDAEIGDDFLDRLPPAEIRPSREGRGDYTASRSVNGKGHPASRDGAYEANLPPGARHRQRMAREREDEEEPARAKAG
jgi:hypothetical protein